MDPNQAVYAPLCNEIGNVDISKMTNQVHGETDVNEDGEIMHDNTTIPRTIALCQKMKKGLA